MKIHRPGLHPRSRLDRRAPPLKLFRAAGVPLFASLQDMFAPQRPDGVILRTRNALHEAGDHFLLVGKVEKASFEPRRDPLLYFRGKYRRLHFT